MTPTHDPTHEPQRPHADAAAELDPFFTFDYTARPDLGEDHRPDQRLSNYWDLERLCRGPEPVPDWLVTDNGAIDTELGILKTGKEADVHLLERAATDGTGAITLVAAKRYRTDEHRQFHRSASYAESRRARKSRDTRAVSMRTSAYGRQVRAAMWVGAEWQALRAAWHAGAPVPYPIQVDGNEILMQFFGDGRQAAPRLAQTRPTTAQLEQYLDQVREAMMIFASLGWAHGDLSPYNTLVHRERIVVIDLPQVVDLAANPQAMDFLMRDCRTMARWFTSRGLPVEEQELFSEVVAYAF